MSGSCTRTTEVAVVVWALPMSGIVVDVRLKSLSSSGRFLCPVVVDVQLKSLSLSGRFLCPVVVDVRLKSLSSSGLSSAELAPSAIPSLLLPNGVIYYVV